ncbi:MAG TPA: RluA family pseudouridine synthase [Leucothrix mucor]|nr:RluA family pseudouridine synthase [Leucothrix mucor]
MQSTEHYFTPFKESIDSYSLPEKFTFPFYYDPHPLCLLATKELQHYLKTQTEWQHPFGLEGDTKNAIGKMFGVLLVENTKGEVGYLSAFSGKLANQNHHSKFVPPVFDMLAKDSFFKDENTEINKLNEAILTLENNPKIEQYKDQLDIETQDSNMAIKIYRDKMIEARKIRKQQRIAAKIEMDSEQFIIFNKQLANQSVQNKNQLRHLNHYWEERLNKAKVRYELLIGEIKQLKIQRKESSSSLQRKLFEQYRFLNKMGVEKSLQDIFDLTPPAGSGECAAPKLLQYVFKHQLKPLAMAEFWWGASPKSAIRKHQNFYPACNGKCQPILSHMLKGVVMDENPLLINPAKEKVLDIIYEDDVILVVNKPTELLSVPGKNVKDCVYQRIKQSHPQASGPLIVHRLDMSTSGLMVIALTKHVHKQLQRQFIKRMVKKRYVALLSGLLEEEGGAIDLPLRVDLADRPRQLVCYEHGRAAQTQWKTIERNSVGQTRVHFYPVTGRTHQLRVHAAHNRGLNTPIVGDDLYGDKENRLHLHAEYIEFTHPIRRERISFFVEADF